MKLKRSELKPEHFDQAPDNGELCEGCFFNYAVENELLGLYLSLPDCRDSIFVLKSEIELINEPDAN